MYLFGFLIAVGLARGAAATVCDMNAYCRQVGGPLSYCKNWQTVSTCYNADQYTNCVTCGVSTTSSTTIKATTVAGTTTTVKSTTSTPSSTKASSTAATTTKAATTLVSTTKATTTVTSTTKAVTTVTSTASTTKVSTVATTATAGSTACDRNAYCRQVGGPLSYCKDWLAVSSCYMADKYTNCVTCGSTATSATTTIKATTVVSTTTVSTTKATTLTSTTKATTVTTTAAAAVVTTVAPSISSGCESLPSTQVPLFLWAEMPSIKTRAEFVAFYQRLAVFLNANCVNMRTTTLVVRVVHPTYPTATDPMFWPPSSSPLYTELISKISVKSGNKIKILLYPYVMEDYDRVQWVQFAQSVKATPLLNNQMSVYDGVFAFTKAWQDFVASSASFMIDGFMIDYEEISKRMGTQYLFDFTSTSVGPYKAAFPKVKLGTSVGYDDASKIKNFDPFVDYFHLQVYDFFYPYAGADKSPTDSIFEVYKDDPSGFLSTVLANVLTPTVLKAYAGRESKIKLMWSTQTLSTRNCLYPLRDGSCGVNYEFAWNPAKFNQLVQIMLVSPQLGPFEHGIYTYNFMRQDWLVKSSRSR